MPLAQLLTALVLVACVQATSSASQCQPRPATVAQFVKLPFDYIVVGGGTAGTALSARLAEERGVTVGLIEAGNIHLNDPNIDTPGLSGIGNASFDWLFSSVPQPALGEKVISVPRGKMLGGSSGINGMAWGRASAREYDALSTFSCDSSWSWAGLLPFMRKTETFTLIPGNPYPGISLLQDSQAALDSLDVDGFNGSIVASHNSFIFDPVFKVVETLNSLGVPTNAEPQAGNATGVTNTLLSIDRAEGVRSYAAPTYYCSHAQDSNYHATKVHFTKKGNTLTATGVEFVVGGKTYVANAKKEIILSAGAIQTPQLLELSGIGNATILKQHGIKTLIDLPQIGENLQEHLFVAAQWQVKPGVETFDLLRNDPAFAAQQQKIYAKTHTGLFAATDSLIAFLTLQNVVSPAELESLLATFDQEASETTSPLTQLQNSIRREWFAKGETGAIEILQWTRGLFDPAANLSYVALLGGIVHPSSRGSVHLNSSNPLAAPTIDFRLASSDFDKQVLIQIVKFLQKIGTQSPFSDIIVEQTNPDPNTQSDEELLQYINFASSIGDHSIGTAAMAPKDKGGVVDHTLTVYGTSNLRVVDASVIPLHIAAHTQATVYAIAEKARILASPARMFVDSLA
ncbi:GMC oxidoreductase [Trametes coccinea BRFM310]|uniref:GMC oxidoreductase n=1 Tax=Trametes coccinea (strain BRFM310) TaxID=1353009 RepID=A0A1Y2J2M0_TRAC3|nr:GMC oxidoreductase [Trametes coccinea BRFM310]